jgi:hypothetical protein
MLKHDAMFFVVALFFIFLIWLATGGPSRPISWAGPFLNPPAPLGSGKAYFLSGAGFGTGGIGGLAGFTIGAGGSHLSVGGSSSIDTSAYFTNPSPYRGQVFFDSSPDDPQQQLATAENLRIVAASNGSPIDITGWKLVSASSYGTIPQGALVPVSGTVNATSDIVLQPGESAIVNSGTSPIGVSFRENECTGYLDQYQGFHPSLDRACPSVRSGYDDAYGTNNPNDEVQECSSFLGTIARCQTVTNFPYDSQGNSEISNSCRQYVEAHDTYNGCVADYRADADFAGDTWRVFLGSKAGLWGNNHDTIRLVDAQGRTVDVFAY